MSVITKEQLKAVTIDLKETFSTRDGRFYPAEIGGRSYEFPSVTTILDMVRIKGFLDKWEAELIEFMGVDGHKKYMEKKADEGTAVHHLIEYFLDQRGASSPKHIDRFNIEDLKIPWNEFRLMTTKDVNDYAWAKFITWNEWWKEEMVPLNPKVIWQEKKLFSELHGVAGRSDILFEIGKELWIYDWKSGKSSDKHKLQVSTYIKMEEEGEGTKLAGGRILTLGEETRSGWKLMEVSATKKHKNSEKGESEVDYYFRFFCKLKEVVECHCPNFGPNNKTLPRYILPHKFP